MEVLTQDGGKHSCTAYYSLQLDPLAKAYINCLKAVAATTTPVEAL